MWPGYSRTGSARPPNGPPSCDDDWPFFPSYNPLEYDSPPAEQPTLSSRLGAEAKRIAFTAAWRTALFAVGSLIFYHEFVAHGLLAEVIR